MGFATLWGMGLAAALYLGRDRGLARKHLHEITETLNAAPNSLEARPLESIDGISRGEVAPLDPAISGGLWYASQRGTTVRGADR